MALVFRDDKLIDTLRNAYLAQRHENSFAHGDAVPPPSRPDTRDQFASAPIASLQRPPSALSGQSGVGEGRGSGLEPIPAAADAEPGPEPEPEPEPDFEPSSIGDPKSLKLQQLELDFDDDSDFDNELLPLDEGTATKYSPSRRTSAAPSPTKVQEVQNSMFARRVLRQPNVHSQLSDVLIGGTKDPREQYLEASAGVSISSQGGLRLKVHFSNNKFIEVVVRRDCTTHLAIGYAIYKAGIKPGDANLYNLHLAEDDGRPDEDFPALDRRRLVSSYHVEELAIVRATEKEFAENSKQTPNKIQFARAGQRPASAYRTQDKRGSAHSNASTNSAGSIGLSGGTVTVKMYMHPFDPLLSQPFWVKSMVPCDSKIGEVFQHMCWEKMMDTDMFILRSVDTTGHAGDKESLPVIANMSQTVSEFLHVDNAGDVTRDSQTAPGQPLDVSFEIVARRNLNGPQGARKSMVHKSPQKKEKTTDDLLENAVMTMQPLGFYKYPVIRRQQMNFLGRSERELIIDGEYIHLMPLADWSVLDQPKTTTFHIRQVLRVKQSSKVATNLSIIIMKPNGPKRYDLECESRATVVEIITRLQRLRKTVGRVIL